MSETMESSISIGHLEAALARLGAEHEPPRGWQARVFAAIDRRPRWCLWRLAIPLAAVILLAPAVWLRSRPTADGPPLLVTVEPAGPMRGSSAHVGDHVHVTATSSDPHRALWVYRNDHELVIACPGGPACRRAGTTITADLTLLAVGRYMFVAITAPAPLPAPVGSYDPDRAAAEEAHAAIHIQPLEVR